MGFIVFVVLSDIYLLLSGDYWTGIWQAVHFTGSWSLLIHSLAESILDGSL